MSIGLPVNPEIKLNAEQLVAQPLISRVRQALIHQLIGLEVSQISSDSEQHSRAKQRFKPCSVSLSPWRLTHFQFEQAIATAKALSQLFQAVSENRQFLQQSLADFNDDASLLFHLKTPLANPAACRATGLNLSRQDLLLDSNGHWKLVESNAIAAGMGPFSERLGRILDDQMPSEKSTLAPNNASVLIAETIYSAAHKNRGSQRPLVIFVVEPNEDNIHDQNYIADQITQMGGLVIRKTFSELEASLSSENERLQLKDFGTVDLLYFRTGYNAAQYFATEQSANGEPQSKSQAGSISSFAHRLKYLSLRRWIEEHQVVVAPAIHQQVTASKWVQSQLAGLTPQQLSELFYLTDSTAQLASLALQTSHFKPTETEHIEKRLASGEWILKSQDEGGGNVFNKISDLPQIDLANSQWLLMKKIQSTVRSEGVNILRENQSRHYSKVISELGIFTLGEQHQYGGYLLRSKPDGQLETGVHQAGGFLDSIRLI
jgi:glutathione synthase